MSSFIVEGGIKLKGDITVSGNKNEALPLIVASLMTGGETVLSNCPDIGDVRSMLSIAEELGASVSVIRKGKVRINSGKPVSVSLPFEKSVSIRGSILFASALLVRKGKAEIPQPGGDTIGRRRLDTHFLVFKSFGAKLEIKRSRGASHAEEFSYVLSAAKGLKGADIYLDETSVTATENALIAAAGAKGKTVIANAASEPHVQGLCRFLQKAGVRIEGIGSNMLTIYGTDKFRDVSHCVGSDHIEAGSFISLAASTGSEITVSNVDTEYMRMICFQFMRLGVKCRIMEKERSVHVPGNQALKIRSDLGGTIPKIEDGPWPAFPADLTTIMLVTAVKSKGTCIIHEKMFESRLFFVDNLIGMGAKIVLCDPHRAVVVGPSRMYGSVISSPDIRAGMALLIAAMAAEGKSVIHNIEQIDRGYEKIDKRLNAVGAEISRGYDRRKR